MSLPTFQDVPAWLQKPAREFLTPQEIKQLDAIFRRILPEDTGRQIPGAVAAGASNFVSQLLAMDDSVYLEIKDWRTLYRAALPALNDYCKRTYGTALPEADDKTVNEILASLEVGTLAGLPPTMKPQVVFKTFLRHCIQGCFADPRWGGNKDKIMWRAIGYLQPPEDLLHG